MVTRLEIPSDARNALKGYPMVTPIVIQWGDQDAMGHVNNVVYFRWFETARIDFLDQFRTTVKMDKTGVGPILASIQCDYRRQLHYPDNIYVGSKVSRIGRSSVGVSHAIYSEALGAIAAEGTSVLVIFDYAANRSVRIPDELRELMEASMGS
jgi:acyl-CoA thioester hydrolase